VPPAPILAGKVIVVSLVQQWLYAYEDGKLVFDHAVGTGRPELPTPVGTFTILEKSQDVVFTSPWPKDSPYYYEPTPINYAMLFKEGGFFLHDAPWHVQFGPGSNVPHQLPDGSWETGSHGCVGMPIPDAKRLYEWLPVGTPVIIRN
jgi:lipoprotein-anchoring transpeptidase ErfK/SrfK